MENKANDRYGIIENMMQSEFYKKLNKDALERDVKTIEYYTIKADMIAYFNRKDLSNENIFRRIQFILATLVNQMVQNRINIGNGNTSEVVKIDELFNSLVASKNTSVVNTSKYLGR